MGYICPHCYQWVNEGNIHVCYSSRKNDNFKFNYECPQCHGKFNCPSLDCTEGNTTFKGIYKNYRCPFCGLKMVGLEDWN